MDHNSSTSPLSSNNPLEDLLTKALAKQTPQKARRKPGSAITPEALARFERRMKLLFTDPANWTRTRHVALIHEETDTLLGNFAEYVHNTATGCRKLLRVEAPVQCDAAEFVSGMDWLAGKPFMQPTPEQVEERELILDLHLKELAVFSPTVLVTIRLEFGGVVRVELADDTRFFSKERHNVLELTAGTDVLEVMSLENKLEMKAALDGGARDV